MNREEIARAVEIIIKVLLVEIMFFHRIARKAF